MLFIYVSSSLEFNIVYHNCFRIKAQMTLSTFLLGKFLFFFGGFWFWVGGLVQALFFRNLVLWPAQFGKEKNMDQPGFDVSAWQIIPTYSVQPTICIDFGII